MIDKAFEKNKKIYKNTYNTTIYKHNEVGRLFLENTKLATDLGDILVI